jgi:integrase
MRFPKIIRHRKAEVTIYGKTASYGFYRIAYHAAGKRHLRNFKTYGEAKDEAERIVRELATGSHSDALTAGQSRDALAALERLDAHFKSTGKRIGLNAAVEGYLDAVGKLNVPLRDAVEGYLGTVATVKRKDVGEAVEEFIVSRRHKTEAKEGKRALSPSYVTHFNSWVRGFAGAFPATAVCDLTKDHVNLYFKPLTEVSAKNRNDRRAAVTMFLNWAARNDYLPKTHRLFEADGMTRETVESADTDFFRPAELQKLLDNASADLQPVLAIAGLAGLRGEEIMRLDWSDVWRVEGHVEVTARNAKTRQRRLIEICPALASWLEPFKANTAGKLYPAGVHVFQRQFVELRDGLKIPARRNGLRHAFCSYHFALHANEGLTAQQAGNSPAMIHAHYKGLATKADAEKWFGVMPAATKAN